jgi:hypothetical protein
MSESKFILRDKVEQFIAELYVALRRYPKSERHVLAAETRQSEYRLLRNVIVASKVRAKNNSLESADTEVQVINALMRVGMQLTYLPFRTYERLAKLLDEIGRMLGGWIKRTT